jgi:hypothetical protein
MSEQDEPTVEDVQALVCAATPHFALQIRARVRDLIAGLPEDHPARRYGEEQIALLERLSHSTTKAADGPIEAPTRIGWEFIPSHRPAGAGRS